MKTNSYPAWFYGPAGASAIFNEESEVPAGWQDHPSKIITPEKTGSKPLPPVVDQISGAPTGTKPVEAKNNATAEQTGGAATGKQTGDVSNTLDSDGWAFDPEMHAATQSLTKAGLWRMKVGVSRPEPKPGYPKPALDL